MEFYIYMLILRNIDIKDDILKFYIIIIIIIII